MRGHVMFRATFITIHPLAPCPPGQDIARMERSDGLIVELSPLPARNSLTRRSSLSDARLHRSMYRAVLSSLRLAPVHTWRASIDYGPIASAYIKSCLRQGEFEPPVIDR